MNELIIRFNLPKKKEEEEEYIYLTNRGSASFNLSSSSVSEFYLIDN
jgi:hypothetical protein